MVRKQQLIDRLQHTYCRLQPSSIHGVGVFAIRDIPAGIDPFYGSGDPDAERFTKEELQDLDPEVLRLIDDFLVFDKDGSVEIPEEGINGLTMAFYVNHSDNPNLTSPDNGLSFRTNREIKKGEELTAGYRTYDPRSRSLISVAA